MQILFRFIVGVQQRGALELCCVTHADFHFFVFDLEPLQSRYTQSATPRSLRVWLLLHCFSASLHSDSTPSLLPVTPPALLPHCHWSPSSVFRCKCRAPRPTRPLWGTTWWNIVLSIMLTQNFTSSLVVVQRPSVPPPHTVHNFNFKQWQTLRNVVVLILIFLLAKHRVSGGDKQHNTTQRLHEN